MGRGGSLMKWQRKIDACKGNLENWSRKRFKEGTIKIEDMINKLDCLQENWEKHYELISELTELIDKLDKKEEK